MADILYTYGQQVYANITNRCNCRCSFCIRFLRDGVGSADTLWHRVNPTKAQVLEAIRAYDFTGVEELVFCGYGEPTCAMDILLAAAGCAKEEKGLRVRLNTNGLGSAENGEDIVPALAKVTDSVSISLNAPTREAYDVVTRPQLADAFDAMRDFAIRCGECIPDVRWTVVDVLSEAEMAACRRLADDTGIPLRVRHFG